MIHGEVIEPDDITKVQLARQARIRAEMVARDIAAVVLVDPVNIRYATDTRNMQIFTARNPARYVFIAADGPTVLFDFAGCQHLATQAPTVDEIRTAKTASYVAAGDRLDDVTRSWALEITDLVRSHCGDSRRIGLERFNAKAAFELERIGFDIVDAQVPVERARTIKVPGEVAMMKSSMGAVEEAVALLRDNIVPGVTENEIWSKLWEHVIKTGGDYVETRLLSSGPRTNPWFQESSDRVIQAGELVSLDTDVVGRYGYYADFSRSFICGEKKPTRAQRNLYQLAFEQVHHNMELVKPGMYFSEVAAKGWVIPDEFVKHRYYVLAHGIGMTGEYPYILYSADQMTGGYDGVIEPNMMLCVESFIGSEKGGEGVKLEQQVLVTDTGYELISHFPFDENLLGREV